MINVLEEAEKITSKIENCPLCHSSRLHDLFIYQGFQVQICQDCRLQLLNPQPSDEVLASIYGADYFLADFAPDAAAQVARLKRTTAGLYLDMLTRYSGYRQGKLLEVGSGMGDMLAEAQSRGFEVTGIEYSAHAVETARRKLAGGSGQVLVGEIDDLNLPDESFDVCILSDVLEHVRQPEQFMQTVHRLLKPNGVVFVSVPSLDSWSARLLGKHWMEFKSEHLYYYNSQTLQNLLFKTSFGQVWLQPNRKVLTLGYIFAHFDRYPVPVITSLTRLATRLIPAWLLKRPLKLTASGRVALAHKQPVTTGRKLSVVMPVFNERATFSQVIELLLAKQIENLDMEVIIVESNSTDGTRQEVLKYQDHPRVNLILEEKPQGKGHAVRTGLTQATGDFILIQDADLEYDLADYEKLLEPLRSARTAFVLGSRHGLGGIWKMRQFSNQPGTSFMMNSGHILFCGLLNLLYFQRLKDPFTMYKVFRRDCLSGLKFYSNRFDFDFELVIKLLRKGYQPVEVPVKYTSRSFKEGKKVTVVRDPLTWLRALVRFRFQPLRLVENIQEASRAETGKAQTHQ